MLQTVWKKAFLENYNTDHKNKGIVRYYLQVKKCENAMFEMLLK